MVTEKVVFAVNACAFILGACLGFYYGVKYRDSDEYYDDTDEYENFEKEDWKDDFKNDTDDPTPLSKIEYRQLANDLGYSSWVEKREHPKEEDDNAEDLKQYIITEEQFSEEKFEYDKKCVSYYRDSEELIDDLTEESLDIGFTIGTNVMKYILDELADYNFVVYSRNDATSVDYEITMINGKASDYGIGIDVGETD